MKKITVFLTGLLLVLLTAAPVAATGNRVNDGAGLLTSEEKVRLEERLSRLAQTLDMEVAVATVDSTEGESVKICAIRIYELLDYGDDGVLLLISMEERDYYILTAGKGEELLTYGELGKIQDAFLEQLSGGAYFDAFSSFADGVEQYAATEYKAPVGWLICIGIGIAVGFVAVGILKGQLKSVHSRRSASNYVVSGSFRLTGSNEFFLFRNVTRMEKPSAKSGSVGVGGGRSYGGRGGKF